MAMKKTLKMSIVGIINTKGLNSLYDNVVSLACEKQLSWIAEQNALDEVKKAKAKPSRPWRQECTA